FAQAVREQSYDFANFYFRATDALSYYALLRERKPSAVIEIGQGMSTRIAVAALQKNAQETSSVPTMLSIDPYSRLLSAELNPQAIHFNVMAQRIQDVPSALVLDLCGPSTFVFVDSSHVYKAGSDVWYLTHQIYPRLPVGTLLHIHDILL